MMLRLWICVREFDRREHELRLTILQSYTILLNTCYSGLLLSIHCFVRIAQHFSISYAGTLYLFSFWSLHIVTLDKQ